MTQTSSMSGLSPIRRAIAARMMEAKQQIPHYRVGIDVELDRLMVERRAHNSRFPDAFVSINDCVIKACADLLITYPAFNVQFIDRQLYRFDRADIAFVVAVTDGLSTPVVRNADLKDLSEIAAETKSLADRARRGSLTMNAIEGGTFTISNLGGSGIDAFDAIINPPQCSILAVASAKAALLPCPTAGVRTAHLVRMTLSVDHRIIDGTPAAEFMRELKHRLEDPALLFTASRHQGDIAPVAGADD